MRRLQGMPKDINGESISSLNLMDRAVSNPDKLPIIYQAFKGEAPLSSYLGLKGYFTEGLRDNTAKGNYRVVKSNHVQFAIKMDRNRKPLFVDGPNNRCFEAYDITRPGYGNSPLKVYLDSNYVRPNEVIILGDAAKTQLFVYDEREPEEFSGGYIYNVKIVGQSDEYADPLLMQVNDEVGVGMTLYEHDFSDTGSEKYAFDAWGDAYMSLQRVKMSWSGTAAVMGEGDEWYEHNGKVGFFTKAQADMMRRIAEYHEFQIIYGKGTVAVDGQVILKNRLGKDILAGDGIVNQGDGAYEYPINREWTLGALENIMNDLDLSVDHEGVLEVIAPMGKRSYQSITSMFQAKGFVTQNNNIVGDGKEKGINNDYKYYEIGGVRVIPVPHKSFSRMPGKTMSDGTKLPEWESLFIPGGKTEYGENKVELVQLRPMKTGTVSGIDKGGDGMASSVDGSSKHVLIQSGVISRTKIIRAFRNIR